MRPRAYGVITAAFFTISIAYAVRYGYGILLPGILDELKISKTEAGMISASYFTAYTICSPLLGLWSDRINPRILLSVFTALLAAGTVMMAYVTNVLEASLAFGLVGIGHAACWAPVVSQVQLWVEDRYRGTALAVATMGNGIGIAAWSMWLPVVVERSGYQAGWLQMGVFAFGVVFLNVLLFRSSPERDEKKREKRKKSLFWSEYRNLLGSPILWVVGMSYACVGFTVLVPFTFLNVYATMEMGLSYKTATSFFTVLAVGGMIGKLVLGILSDRLGRLTIMRVCALCLGFGCLGIIRFEGLSGKFFSVFMIGIGFGAVWPIYAAAAMDLFPRGQSGSVIGLWTVFLGVGSILSPVLCGWSIDFTGSHGPAFYLGFGGGLLAAVLLLPLSRLKEFKTRTHR